MAQRQDAEALRLIGQELTARPNHPEPLALKASLEMLQSAESIYKQMEPSLDEALETVRKILDEEKEYPAGKDLRRDLQKWKRQAADQGAELRKGFDAQSLDRFKMAFADAKTAARDASNALIDARPTFERKAGEEEKGLFRLGSWGGADKGKADRIREAGRKLETLGKKIGSLSK
ncbi:MAG: hypothetical protein M5U26_09155 [Planctomycetota bacterium]|nr:hypothetical protein [Planctomycetota bacterium]